MRQSGKGLLMEDDEFDYVPWTRVDAAPDGEVPCAQCGFKVETRTIDGVDYFRQVPDCEDW